MPHMWHESQLSHKPSTPGMPGGGLVVSSQFTSQCDAISASAITHWQLYRTVCGGLTIHGCHPSLRTPAPPPSLLPTPVALPNRLQTWQCLRYVYDGEFEGQMCMLHDSNKRLIKVTDIYPEFSDFKKGDYTIRLQLRHDDAVLLDKMKDIPVVVERKLKEPLTVPVFATVRDAVKGAKPVKERSMYAGQPCSFVVSV